MVSNAQISLPMNYHKTKPEDIPESMTTTDNFLNTRFPKHQKGYLWNKKNCCISYGSLQ